MSPPFDSNSMGRDRVVVRQDSSVCSPSLRQLKRARRPSVELVRPQPQVVSSVSRPYPIEEATREGTGKLDSRACGVVEKSSATSPMRTGTGCGQSDAHSSAFTPESYALSTSSATVNRRVEAVVKSPVSSLSRWLCRPTLVDLAPHQSRTPTPEVNPAIGFVVGIVRRRPVCAAAGDRLGFSRPIEREGRRK